MPAKNLTAASGTFGLSFDRNSKGLGKRSLDLAIYYAPLFLLCLFWEGVSRSGLVSVYVLPPLSEVILAGWRLAANESFYAHLAVSAFRLAAGLGAAVAGGIVLGWLMASFRPLEAMINPVIQFFYPLPKSALIPLTLLWFGLGEMSKIFPIFLGCLLPIVLSTYNGVRASDKLLRWSAASLGATRLQMLIDVALRGAVPDMLAGARTALALAFALLVSAEFLISSKGVGYLIRLYGESSLYPNMFAVILSVALLGFLCDRAYLALVRRLLRWRQ